VASTYLKLGSIVGPVNATGSTAAPSGQPTGFGLDGVFETQFSVHGVASSTSSVFATGAAAGKASASEMQMFIEGSPRSPDIFLAAAKGTVHPRACVIVAANATGGVATEWVKAYYLMRDVVVTSCRTITDDGSFVGHEIGLSYGALFNAYFATPSGGTLGARSQQAWDFAANTAWTNGI
jgi:hypothetical protein